MQEMKYFNEGNDCDICKNQLMTGRDGTVEDCRRRQNVRICISQRIVMESRSDWCVTDAIRESCQKDMTGNITQRQTNRLRTTIESRNGQQSPVCVG